MSKYLLFNTSKGGFYLGNKTFGSIAEARAAAMDYIKGRSRVWVPIYKVAEDINEARFHGDVRYMRIPGVGWRYVWVTEKDNGLNIQPLDKDGEIARRS